MSTQSDDAKSCIRFPDGFLWGAATSAYQIEGGVSEEGRKPSIWDTFSHQKGHVRTGETGDTAADHYHRWQQDVDLMEAIGLEAYRFSVAWTRIVPDGKGAVNLKGLDWYSRLVDTLLEKGITPYPTLFHYDLPQGLQDAGGWLNRDTAGYFGDYARIVTERLSDRVTCWITHNEPWVTAFHGHLSGEHAPGMHSPTGTLAALHHVLLSHGYAVQSIRAAARRPAKVGIALNLSPVYPAAAHDAAGARFTDSVINRITLDPILKGQYPGNLTASWLWHRLESGVRKLSPRTYLPEDMKVISAPLDFVGVNYYSRTVVRYIPLVRTERIRPTGNEYSDMWEIYPPGIYDLLVRLNKDYAHPNLIVTENGVPVPDRIEEGRVHDVRRIRYLRDHILQVHRAMEAGVPVTGYFVWSLLDNFEWVYGYTKRFGLVYVDFATQQRIMKDSGLWFGQVIRENGVRPDPDPASVGG